MSAGRSGARVRANAARAVDEVVARGRSLDAALAEADALTSEQDRPLLRMLCYGAIRNHWQLRALADALVERPFKDRDSVIGSLLAIGLYQLSESRVPQHAAVSATVEATRLLRRPKLAGMVNACLRNFLRQTLQRQPVASEEQQFNHPAWLIERLKVDWPACWEQLLAANNARAPMWLRVNKRHLQAQDYLHSLDNAGALLPGFEQAVRLDLPRPIVELPGFASGIVSVQDGAAQLAAPWLLQGGGQRILDACAAPGGKTGHLLELAAPDAVLTAVELKQDRLTTVRETLERLRQSAQLVCGDASEPAAWWDGRPFDRILLDAPCSASGVIRRHPDIKLLRRETDVGVLARQQRKLLSTLWTLLAPGGRLLYVTCSVLAEENDQVVSAFLRNQADAREQSLLPNNNIRDVMRRTVCGHQVLPGDRGLDGFYYACLEKSA